MTGLMWQQSWALVSGCTDGLVGWLDALCNWAVLLIPLYAFSISVYRCGRFAVWVRRKEREWMDGPIGETSALSRGHSLVCKVSFYTSLSAAVCWSDVPHRTGIA